MRHSIPIRATAFNSPSAAVNNCECDGTDLNEWYGCSRHNGYTMSQIFGFRNRAEYRSFSRLANGCYGRALKVFELGGANAALRSGSSVAPLFESKLLNCAILIKHNVRPEEQHLFPAPLPVATKIFIPYDTARLEIGGRTFFVEEELFAGYFASITSIHNLMDLSAHRDYRILMAISSVPTLDPFIVKEYLRSEGINFDQSLFSESYAVACQTESETFQLFKPLLQKALGKAPSEIELKRFFEQVWNVNRATLSNPFLEALQIPREEWVSVIFAWKALIYYGQILKESWKRLWKVHEVLRGIRIRGDQRDVPMLTNDFICALDKLHVGASGYIQSAVKQMVTAILSDANANAMADSLRSIAGRIASVGTDVSLFEQATSYFLFLYPSPRVAGVTSDDFCAELNNLCEIISLNNTGF